MFTLPYIWFPCTICALILCLFSMSFTQRQQKQVSCCGSQTPQRQVLLLPAGSMQKFVQHRYDQELHTWAWDVWHMGSNCSPLEYIGGAHVGLKTVIHNISQGFTVQPPSHIISQCGIVCWSQCRIILLRYVSCWICRLTEKAEHNFQLLDR